ncbi:hypothetical protein Tco_0684661 [Tanacetum coccineum]
MFPSYIAIKEPLRRLYHRLIAFTIAGRGQAPEKYLFRHAEGRKEGAKMFGGHFIARLPEHFGLLTEERLLGLTVVVRDLTEIDMDELVKLRICERLLELPTWVAPGPERHQVATAGAAQADQEILEEGVQDDPAPVQAPQVPLAALSSRTVPQRLLRLEEEVHGLRDSIGE